jgi:predicted nucleic acid-binding protein
MRIIVDTNLVFSAILNTKSTIGDLLLNSGHTFDFYSCYYLWTEINIHRDKLQKISKMTEKELV